MPTAWGLYPTPKASIIEPVVLAPWRSKEDFMSHPPVVSPPSLRLTPNEFRHDAKSPMLHEFIGTPMTGVG
jgi:hypothetical protein